MRPCLLVFAFVALAGFSAAQGFECQAVGAFPNICCADCENVQSNASLLPDSGGTGIDNTVTCGFPTAGAQYARIEASGPLNVPAGGVGGTIPRPIDLSVAELRIPVPSGATAVSFKFDFFNAEVPNEATFNDGFAASICAFGTDLSLVDLAYRDTFSANNGCVDSVSNGVETGSVGVDSVTHVFTATELAAIAAAQAAGGAYLSLACWNGGDDSVDSGAGIDCVSWDSFFDVPNTGALGGASRIDNVTANPADTFTIGAPGATRLRVHGISEAVFIEGFHCLVAQVYGDNFVQQFPAAADGGFFIDPTRPFVSLSEGQLTGGLAAGTAARGPIVNLSFANPALCGSMVVFQAYIQDENFPTNVPTVKVFTIASIGSLH